MIAWAGVEWADPVRFTKRADLEELDDGSAEFYAVFSAKKAGRNQWDKPYRLLYVGKAYKQSVVSRLTQNHQAYGALLGHLEAQKADRQTLVMLGELLVWSPERVTGEFIGDVEQALIFCNQPKLNVQHKKTYTGRPLVVVNGGDYAPLKRYAKSTEAAFRRWKDEGGEADFADSFEDDED